MIKNKNLLHFAKVLFIFIFFSFFANSVFAEEKTDVSNSVDSQKTEVVENLQSDDDSKTSEKVEVGNSESASLSDTAKSELSEESSKKTSLEPDNSDKNNKKKI